MVWGLGLTFKEGTAIITGKTGFVRAAKVSQPQEIRDEHPEWSDKHNGHVPWREKKREADNNLRETTYSLSNYP